MKVTIFLPISRYARIDPMIQQIKTLYHEGIELDILVILDDADISALLTKQAFESIGYPVKVLHTGNPLMNDFNIGQRRSRITDVFKLAQKSIPNASEMVFVIEDDTDIGPDFLTSLIADYEHLQMLKHDVGLVSGIQAGRQGFKIIGAWRVDNPKDLRVAETILINDIIEEVDATGFYCFVCSREDFCNANITFGQFGPDVYFGLDLRTKGKKNFIDSRLRCGHVVNSLLTIYPDDCVVVRYEKVDNVWKRTLPKGIKL